MWMLLFCSSSCKQICETPHSYGQFRSSQMLHSSGWISFYFEYINKSFESITYTDSKFLHDRIVVWMTPKTTSINLEAIWLEQIKFCLHRCKWELPDQHIDNCIFLPELFFNIRIISTVCSLRIFKATKLLYKAKLLISEPDSCWVTDPVIALIGPAHILFLLFCIQCHEVQHMGAIPPIVSEEQCNIRNTISSA